MNTKDSWLAHRSLKYYLLFTYQFTTNNKLPYKMEMPATANKLRALKWSGVECLRKYATVLQLSDHQYLVWTIMKVPFCYVHCSLLTAITILIIQAWAVSEVKKIITSEFFHFPVSNFNCPLFSIFLSENDAGPFCL